MKKRQAKIASKKHGKRQLVDRIQKPIVGLDLDFILALAGGAIALDQFLRAKCGHCDEWLIQIISSTAKDEEAACELCSLLSNLAMRSRMVKRNGPSLRAIMGWQARMLNQPNAERLRSPDHPRAGDKQDALVGQS